MSELQHQTDLEQAKEKLRQAAETKEAQKDNRTPALLTTPGSQRPVSDAEREFRRGTAKPKKKSFGQKLKEAMMPERSRDETMLDYLVFRILVPGFKRLLGEMAHSAIDVSLGRSPKDRSASAGATHVSNARLYRERSTGGGFSRKGILDDYEWDEATAKDYFNEMLDVAEKYGDLRVSNAYAICGLNQLIRTTDRNWGWPKSLLEARADVLPVDPEGLCWAILLPEARSLI